jgi:hypothetical protein
MAEWPYDVWFLGAERCAAEGSCDGNARRGIYAIAAARGSYLTINPVFPTVYATLYRHSTDVFHRFIGQIVTSENGFVVAILSTVSGIFVEIVVTLG